MNPKLKSLHYFPNLEIKTGHLKESLWNSSKSYITNITPQCTVHTLWTQTIYATPVHCKHRQYYTTSVHCKCRWYYI